MLLSKRISSDSIILEILLKLFKSVRNEALRNTAPCTLFGLPPLLPAATCDAHPNNILAKWTISIELTFNVTFVLTVLACLHNASVTINMAC